MKENLSVENIQTLIWDFGGIFYQVDVDRAIASFEALMSKGDLPFVTDEKQLFSEPLFQEFERGDIEPEQFRKSLREKLKISASSEALDQAWNSLLVGVVPRSVEFLQALNKRYQLIMLSNSNRIHFNMIENDCKDIFDCFEQVYFSFNMGLRKPEIEIYEKVISENKLDPSKTLFIDDTSWNVDGAKKVGLHTSLYPRKGDFEGFRSLLLPDE